MPNRPPLCVRCKHYMPPKSNDLDKKYGFCKLSGLMNVIDGSIQYNNVAIVREFDCRGDWFEEGAKEEPRSDSGLKGGR
jgi:hypothetical protein